jgi:hypothetical protein
MREEIISFLGRIFRRQASRGREGMRVFMARECMNLRKTFIAGFERSEGKQREVEIYRILSSTGVEIRDCSSVIRDHISKFLPVSTKYYIKHF